MLNKQELLTVIRACYDKIDKLNGDKDDIWIG